MEISQNNTDASQKIFHLDQSRFHEFHVGDEFTDVTVKVGKLSIRCHKGVLKHMSAYFNCKFNTLMKGKNTDVVDLYGIDEESLTRFIEMAYSNQLTVDVNNVQQITFVADYFLIDKLKLFCENF